MAQNGRDWHIFLQAYHDIAISPQVFESQLLIRGAHDLLLPFTVPVCQAEKNGRILPTGGAYPKEKGDIQHFFIKNVILGPIRVQYEAPVITDTGKVGTTKPASGYIHPPSLRGIMSTNITFYKEMLDVPFFPKGDVALVLNNNRAIYQRKRKSYSSNCLPPREILTGARF